MDNTKREREIYEREIARLKRQQKVIEREKKKWQKRLETTDWLKILSERGADNDPRNKI